MSIPPQRHPRFAALYRIGDAISQVCAIVAAAALCVIVVINGANVVNRYVFGHAFSWAEELMIFLMILIVFAGAATVTWRNAHIRIELVTEFLPPAARKIAAGGVCVASVGVLARADPGRFPLRCVVYAFGPPRPA